MRHSQVGNTQHVKWRTAGIFTANRLSRLPHSQPPPAARVPGGGKTSDNACKDGRGAPGARGRGSLMGGPRQIPPWLPRIRRASGAHRHDTGIGPLHVSQYSAMSLVKRETFAEGEISERCQTDGTTDTARGRLRSPGRPGGPSSPCCVRRRCRPCWSTPTTSSGILRAAPANEPTVRLSLSDDVFLRSSNWAHVQLGIPLPAE